MNSNKDLWIARTSCLRNLGKAGLGNRMVQMQGWFGERIGYGGEGTIFCIEKGAIAEQCVRERDT